LLTLNDPLQFILAPDHPHIADHDDGRVGVILLSMARQAGRDMSLSREDPGLGVTPARAVVPLWAAVQVREPLIIAFAPQRYLYAAPFAKVLI
jgi:hypothetical protein